MTTKNTAESGRWGRYEATINEWLEKIAKQSIVQRLWDKDATLWKKDAAEQKEIKNRLGWLTVFTAMRKASAGFTAFADEVKAEGFTSVVLLGMGGSSLAPEVIQTVCGNAAGYPSLVVLDSTDAGRVKDVEKSVDLEKTLFIVSSKSGGTIELLSFFKYFYDKLKAVKGEKAGDHFVAITDPATPLTDIAKSHNFRKVFLAPEDVGGRFSALTPFGLVPAALIGVDVSKLLDGAEAMVARCQPGVPAAENPAALLGVAMAVLAEEGRDKLTLLSDGKYDSLGDWIEQLVAESTGKEGVGVVPVVREPLGAAEAYAEDRFFVVTEGVGGEGVPAAALKAIEKAGHPVLRISVSAPEAIGGEFFRWEMATAVACALLKVNTFDQPDVQAAKDRTKAILKGVSTGGSIPVKKTEITLESFFENAEAGDYAAVLAFLPDRPGIRKRLVAAQTAVRDRLRMATTLGFGPRYLHSTGQLHKGGPGTAMFLLITAAPAEDLPVPGEKYTFAQLELAQAMGDFEALESRGRWLFHYRLEGPVEKALDGLLAELNAAIESQAVSGQEAKNS